MSKDLKEVKEIENRPSELKGEVKKEMSKPKKKGGFITEDETKEYRDEEKLADLYREMNNLKKEVKEYYEMQRS